MRATVSFPPLVYDDDDLAAIDGNCRLRCAGHMPRTWTRAPSTTFHDRGPVLHNSSNFCSRTARLRTLKRSHDAATTIRSLSGLCPIPYTGSGPLRTPLTFLRDACQRQSATRLTVFVIARFDRPFPIPCVSAACELEKIEGPRASMAQTVSSLPSSVRFLTPDVIAKIASALGLDRCHRPLGRHRRLSRHPRGPSRCGVSSPSGARQLSNAVPQQRPGCLLDSLTSLIGARARRAFTDTGSGLLSSLLNGHTLDAMTQSVGRFAGVGESSSKSPARHVRSSGAGRAWSAAAQRRS